MAEGEQGLKLEQILANDPHIKIVLGKPRKPIIIQDYSRLFKNPEAAKKAVDLANDFLLSDYYTDDFNKLEKDPQKAHAMRNEYILKLQAKYGSEIMAIKIINGLGFMRAMNTASILIQCAQEYQGRNTPELNEALDLLRMVNADEPGHDTCMKLNWIYCRKNNEQKIEFIETLKDAIRITLELFAKG